ncbi:ribosome small subunit-dependent GTPase A [Planctomicrobium sp. SH668]|uniref:ribosome small subunit-dependent GTPase A n=1 Tax=Planctomicrobium sp. SH668 TaxID=3448126 RepID=UPI003F5B232E
MSAAKKKSSKSRVAFHKNRANRTRRTDLTRETFQDEDGAADLETGERVSGKGELNRFRTVVDDVSDDAETISGRILTAVGANQIRVQGEDNAVYLCSVRRVVRTRSREGRNAVVAGDIVQFNPTSSTEGVIERVVERRSALSRISRNQAHTIVANVDQMVIVASVSEPFLKPGLIDRFVCSSVKGNIKTLICINKIDLGKAHQLQRLVGQYAQMGYPVVMTNAIRGEGVEQLRRRLKGKETVFVGQSGVGKSSLLNAVQPGLALQTGSVSEDTSKGRHTTRVTQLLPLDGGGWIVDTPGIRSLQLWDIQKEEVEGTFRDFYSFVPYCHFPDCTHTHEDRCRVKRAVECGELSVIRYQSYLKIYTSDQRIRD